MSSLEEQHDPLEPPAKKPRTRAKRGASCRVCRQRKLKCDGVKPTCSRCVKSSESDCIYDKERHEYEESTLLLESQSSPSIANANGTSHGSDVPARPFVARVAGVSRSSDSTRQEARIRHLERTVFGLQEELKYAKHPRVDAAPQPRDSTPDLLGVQSVGHPLERFVEAFEESRNAVLGQDASFRTFYWGAAYWGVAPVGTGLAAEHEAFLAELQSFKRRHATLGTASHDLKTLDKAKKAAKKRMPSSHSDRLYLANLLPDKSRVDELVDLYFTTVDHIYHILHHPQFRRQYSDFWAQPYGSRINSPFICVLLLMLSCVNCVNEPAVYQYIGNDASYRARSVTWILAVDEWTKSHSQKYLTLQYFQIHCLLQISKRMNGTHIKRWYVETGTLVRLAISVGFHLDVEGSKIGGVLSDFDREMRRRLWCAICELETTACLLRGLPSMLISIEASCPSPKVMFDEQIPCPGIGAAQLLRNEAGPSPVRYLLAVHDYRPLELRLLRRLNNPNYESSTEDLLMLEDETVGALKRCDAMFGDGDNVTETVLPRLHHRMGIFRALLLLNRHASLSAPSESTRRYATQRCVDIARTMIEDHMKAGEQPQMVLTYLHAPVFMAAMSLCLDLAACTAKADDAFPGNTEHVCSLIEFALGILERRAFRVGGVYRRYWLLLTALAAVRSRLQPRQAEDIDRRAGEKLTSVLYKIISSQVDPSVSIPQIEPQLAMDNVMPGIADRLFDEVPLEGEFDFSAFDSLGDLSSLTWDVFLANPT